MDKLDKTLSNMESKIHVPKGLAEKIKFAVSERARQLDKRRALIKMLKLGLTLLFGFYAYTAVFVQISGHGIGSYLSTLFSDPAVFFTGDYLKAFSEQVPFMALVFLLGSAIYFVKQFKLKGIKRYPMVYASVMSMFSIFVLGGVFVFGVSIGAGPDSGISQLADNQLFSPLVESNDDLDYSTYGNVVTVATNWGGGNSTRIIVEMPNGFIRAVDVDSQTWTDQYEGISEGDVLLVVGKAEKDSSNSQTGPFGNGNYQSVVQAQHIQVLEN